MCTAVLNYWPSAQVCLFISAGVTLHPVLKFDNDIDDAMRKMHDYRQLLKPCVCRV